MRFQVPQFIDHEPKVIGPLTFTQFIYLGVPTAIGFFLYFLAPFPVFVGVTGFLEFFGFLFGFVKAQGRPLPGLLISFAFFLFAPKTYIWKKGLLAELPTPAQAKHNLKDAGEIASEKPTVKLTKESKIKTLAMRVETTR